MPSTSSSWAGTAVQSSEVPNRRTISARGREGGLHSLEFYTEMRNVCVKL